MDTPENQRQPVTTAEDMIASLDLLLIAANQWAADDDKDLGALLYQRTSELVDDLPAIPTTPENRMAMKVRVDGIRNAIRQRSINDLNETYHRS